MPEMQSYTPGAFCWADLITTDLRGAQRFYSQLLGLEVFEVPSTGMGEYTMLQKNGKNVCGLAPLPESLSKQGVPPHWTSYVSVTNVDEVSSRVAELGGDVLQPPFDVMKLGRMALVRDTTGAKFALWQPGQNPGAQLFGEPGALCWYELYTRNTKASARFYADLLGWSAREGTSPTGDVYTEYRIGEQPIGGMIEIRPEWGEVPPNWSVYFSAEDLNAVMKKVERLGAKVAMPPMSIENVGEFVLLEDPQGAYFFVIELDQALHQG